MGPLTYIKKELQFTTAEWLELDEAEKEWYRIAALEEMQHTQTLRAGRGV